MTISSSINKIQYNGNDVTALFSTGVIVFYDDSDLVVTTTIIATGVDTTLTLTTDYTVTGGEGAAGSVTLVAGALASTKRITIARAIPYTQPDEFVEGENILAETIETRFDKATIQTQQVKEIADRGLKFPVSDPSTLVPTLPSAAARASKVLAFDADGNPTVEDASADAAAASAAAAAASAVEAANQAANFSATSVTSNSIGTGSKVFETQAGKNFVAGRHVLATSDANPVANRMAGIVSSYSGTTLTVTMESTAGAGTFADWTIRVDGERGAQGAMGAPGTLPIANSGGTVNAITANFTPDITLSDMQTCIVISSGPNTITNPTFSPDGLTARTVVTGGGQALVEGATGAAGYPMFMEYNLANTRWELLNPAKTVNNSGRFLKRTIITASGTFTPLSTATLLRVTSVGAGTDGCGVTSARTYGSTAGGDTTFGAYHTAGGGQAGSNNTLTCVAGDGGTATGGDINRNGDHGTGGFSHTTAAADTLTGPNGASTPFGQGGKGGFQGTNGGNATGYGSGGGSGVIDAGAAASMVGYSGSAGAVVQEDITIVAGSLSGGVTVTIGASTGVPSTSPTAGNRAGSGAPGLCMIEEYFV